MIYFVNYVWSVNICPNTSIQQLFPTHTKFKPQFEFILSQTIMKN